MLDLKPKIIFLGTPHFASPFLQALVKNQMKPVLVITQPDEPVGRKKELTPPPVKVVAEKLGITVSQPKDKREIIEELKKHQPDICVLVAYGQIISPEALLIPKFGFVNVHPSLLPKYRGASPIQTAILNGDNQTGISIIQLTRKVDAGPIVAQEAIDIKPTDTAETLHNSLSQLGAKLLIKILPDYLAGNMRPKPQDESKATYTKLFSRQDGLINWQETASQIEAQFRAFHPWPGVFAYWGQKRLKIVNLSVLEGDFRADLRPGEVFLGQNNTLAIKCGQGAIEIKVIQPEGKKEIPALEFLRGHKEILGVVL